MNETKAKSSFKTAVLVAALVPLIILAIAITVITSISMKNNMVGQVKDDLSDLAYTSMTTFETAIPGEYKMVDGKLMKGQATLSGNYSLLDTSKAVTDVDFTIFFGDTRELTTILDVNTKERIIGTKAGDAVIQTVLKGGKDYFSEDVKINGQDYYGFYTPIKNADGSIIGIMFTGRPCEEINSMITSSVISSVIFSVIILVLAILVIMIWANKSTKALKAVTNSLTVIAGGNLTQPVDIDTLTRKDEIGLIAKSTENLRQALANMITEIAQNAGDLNTSVADIDHIAVISRDSTGAVNLAMDELASATMHNAENTQNANTHMNEMGTIIESISGDVRTLADNAKNMDAIEKTAGNNLDEVIRCIAATSEAVEKIARQADITNEAAQKIGTAVNLISSIAEETTLLSLNASIESARAGELGRGFGVVASQIQKLSDQSSESASDIETFVSELLAESSKTVAVMAEVKEIVAQQKTKIEETQGNFTILAQNVEDSVVSIQQIRKEAEELNKHRAEMNDIIAELSALSEENAASTQETTATIGELDSTISNMANNSKLLSDISQTLKSRVEQFEI